MIIAVYIDRFDNEFIATGEVIEEVIKSLEFRAGEDCISMDNISVFVGEPVKVTKKVFYTMEGI